MERISFAHQPGPMIVGIIRERTLNDAKAAIRNGEAQGARGFDLHLDALDDEFRNLETVKTLVEFTDKPILALNYKKGYDHDLVLTEEERVATLMMAVDAGVAAVDMQGYTFDWDTKLGFVDDEFVPEGFEFVKEKRPKEVAFKPEVIEKQKKFIEEVHAKGAEVLASIHFGVHLSTDELEKFARFARSKGADVVKMVTPCVNDQQLGEVLASTLALKERLDFPFSFHANGKNGKISRMLCPMLGSYIMFCNIGYSRSSNFEQLHLESMINAYRNMGEI